MPLKMKCYKRKQEQERGNMCTHGNTQKINGFRVCMNCGLTVLPDGRIMFDKKICNYKPRKRKKAVNK